jgi:serine/threonine-protein kinase
VAVKTLHAELSRDPSITARFHREVGTVAQLEHPNTVRVYDFGSTDDGTLYIAMEFLDGLALNEVIEKEGALDPRRVGRLLRQIAGSLDEAHGQGFVHRDLKPENVLLIQRAGEKDVVKLVDFGIAARTESADREKEQKLTQQGMVLGTPPYMSPEQFTGKALDLRSDIYSLAVMVYEMLTGQLPFQADTAWQWATHHMTSQPRSFDSGSGSVAVPAALQQVVLKGLSKDPADRQATAGAFHREFEAALNAPDDVAPASPPAASTGTQAMPQAAVAAVAFAPTEAMPAALAASRGGATAPIAAHPVAVPPARSDGERGGRGLIYGVAAVGAILLAAMGAVALGGGKDTTATAVDLGALGSDPSAASAPEEPDPSAEEGDTATAVEPETDEPAAAPPPKQVKPTPQAPRPAPSTPAPRPTPVVTPPAPAPAAPSPVTPPPTPTPTPPAPPVQTAPRPSGPTTPAPNAAACSACSEAVARGDLSSAVALYQQCSDARDKVRCKKRLEQKAPALAKAEAFNGNCNQANAIIAISQQMGVSANRFAAARGACK